MNKKKCMFGGEIMWEGHDFEAGTEHTHLLYSILQKNK